MSTSTLPAPKDVRDMLEGLLFRDVTVAPGTPVDPTKPVGVGVFVDDSHAMAVVAVTDLALAAYAGAAIGLIPVGGAQAAIEDKELAPSVRDNFFEVLNVLSALFNTPGAPHLRLYAGYAPGEAVPTDVAAALRTVGRRLDLKVAVAGYGEGMLSFVLV